MAKPWEDGGTRAAALANRRLFAESWAESYAPAGADPHPPNRFAVGPLLPP